MYSLASQGCDFFLVENIYGKLSLCKRIYRKNKNSNMNENNPLKENCSLLRSSKLEYNNIIKHVTHSFEYNSCFYEYDEKNNEIFPIYMNLSKMKNNDIFNYFNECLSSELLVLLFRERYGKNEYRLNIKLLYLFLMKNQIPSIIIVIIIGFIEYIFLKNYLIQLLFALGIIIIQLIIIKISFINKYTNDFTLDGINKKVRVKRKYLIEYGKQPYYNLNIDELLPGDIILLKNKEFVPCDGIVLNGECLVSESDLTGSLNVYKKIALKNNFEHFNYKNCNINIIYHGMKIVKTFTKSENEFISVLCINIGSNTFKANLFSHIMYFLERKKEYKSAYNLFGERKKVFIYIITNLLISFIGAVLYFSVFLNPEYSQTSFFKNYLPQIIVSVFCKSLMTIFFIIQNILVFFSLMQLNKNNIKCFDAARLSKSGKINKIIFNKTETLSNNYFEIYGYHPVSCNINKPNHLFFKNYSKKQSKDLNNSLFDFYNDYLNNSRNKNNKSEFYNILFLECLLCCNSIEKYDMDYFGNNIELEIFTDFKWDIKQIEESNKNNNNDNFNEIKNIINSKINSYNYYIINKIYDIFPQNYYQLSQASNKEKNKNKETNDNIDKFLRKNTIKDNKSSPSIFCDKIQMDIMNSDNNNDNSCKIRIYKKFIVNGYLDSAAIVYNFITKELRFMIKSIPEEIINKCDKNSIPQNFEKIISFYRKNGFIILICATKKLEIDEYYDNDELNNYLEDLTFVGFITLENKIKDYVKPSIKELKKFNEDFIIVSGDNVYNCLSTGFQSEIIEDKTNLFSLDLEENNKIIIRKIYSVKNHNTEKRMEDNITKTNRNKKNSRIIEKISNINKSKEMDLPELETYINNMNKKIIKEQKRKIKVNTANKELPNINSEYDRIINKRSSTLADINKDQKNKKRKEANKEDVMKKEEELDYKFLNFMEKYYYHDIFKEYDDIKNSIFCLSGGIFNYLNNNKSQKGVKKFMDIIIKKTKIFFNMSSIDKSTLVDYFREDPNNTVCVIGQCESDIDSILSSDVGINLKNPKNINTILCHFYSEKTDIICIKDIIMNGKVFLENNILLESISFLCSLALNGYILCSLIRNVTINDGELNFLEIEYFVLSSLSLLGKNRENIYLNQNSKLLNIYYNLQLSENLIIKFLAIFWFCWHFSGNYQMEQHSRDLEFLSYYFVLSIEFLICGIVCLNFSSFFRSSVFTNYYLISILALYLIYMEILVFLNSSNYSSDILSITNFTFNDNFMDCFTDNNRLYLLISLAFDFFGTLIINFITFLIFRIFIK